MNINCCHKIFQLPDVLASKKESIILQ